MTRIVPSSARGAVCTQCGDPIYPRREQHPAGGVNNLGWVLHVDEHGRCSACAWVDDEPPTAEDIGGQVIDACFRVARAQSAAAKLERATVTRLYPRSGTVTHLGSRRPPIHEEAPGRGHGAGA